jgi:hypothetical protein
MTALFPHPPYAEEQRFSRTILATHVLSRGFLIGSMAGMMTGTTSIFIQRLRSRAAHSEGLANSRPMIMSRHLLRSSLIGTAVTAVMLAGRMRGKEEIEWKDRSWRLLENNGQTSMDWWLLGAAVIAIPAGKQAAPIRPYIARVAGLMPPTIFVWGVTRWFFGQQEDPKALGETVKDSIEKMK